MTIYEIKERTRETAPYFFTRGTMRFFRQTMRSFSVTKQGDKYLIRAKMRDHTGKCVGWTERLFNTETNELESVN